MQRPPFGGLAPYSRKNRGCKTRPDYSTAGDTVNCKLNLYLTLHNVKTNIYVDGFNLYFRCLRSTTLQMVGHCQALSIAATTQYYQPHQILYREHKASPRRSRSALTSEDLLSRIRNNPEPLDYSRHVSDPPCEDAESRMPAS